MNPAERRANITDQISFFDRSLLERAIERNGMIGIPVSDDPPKVHILPPYKEGEPYLPDVYYRFDIVEFLGEGKEPERSESEQVSETHRR